MDCRSTNSVKLRKKIAQFLTAFVTRTLVRCIQDVALCFFSSLTFSITSDIKTFNVIFFAKTKTSDVNQAF